MALFDILKKVIDSAPPQQNPVANQPVSEKKPPKKEERHRIAGTSYQQDAIISLGTLNPNYKLNKSQLIKKKLVNTPVYEYNFKTYEADLVPEPSNEYDPNAIKVMIAGKHVGYIKKGSCAHIKKLINTGLIKSVTATIKGGNQKYVSCYDAPENRDKDSYIYESDKSPIGVDIMIKTI